MDRISSGKWDGCSSTFQWLGGFFFFLCWSTVVYASPEFHKGCTQQAVAGEVRLPLLWQNGMILQQQKKVRVWGWGVPCSMVTVRLGNFTRKVQVSPKGFWLAFFLPHKAGSQVSLTVTGSNKLQRKNLLFGEVWVCSGQSNMVWPIHLTHSKKEVLKRPEDKHLRLFRVRRMTSIVPRKNVYGNWTTANPVSLVHFSATCYHFGHALRKHLKVPVGLIQSDWGGTPSEAWTPVAALKKHAQFKPLLWRWEHAVRSYSPTKAKFRHQRRLLMWKVLAASRKKKRLPVPPKPRMQTPPRYHASRPGNLYRSMIHPLRHLSIAGFVWYQGESNAYRAYQYRSLFPTLIRSWRNLWKQGDLPFYFVQIAPFRYKWMKKAVAAELRDAQLHAFRTVKNTGMVVTLDIGNPKDIHPRNKRDVGKRLARWALHNTYGKRKIVPSGPLYRSSKVVGKEIHLSFDFVGGGLTSCDGKPLNHFYVAGQDKQFKLAKARVSGHTIIVSNSTIAKPVAVRFAWEDDAQPNFCNKAGLPASSFRTDSWPGLTDKRK